MEEKQEQERLTIDELLYFFDNLDNKIEGLETVKVDVGSERWGNLNRRLRYNDIEINFMSYGPDVNKLSVHLYTKEFETNVDQFKIDKNNYQEVVLDTIGKLGKGLCKCSFCNEWVPYSDDRKNHFIPAGFCCDKPKCMEAKLEAEEKANKELCDSYDLWY